MRYSPKDLSNQLKSYEFNFKKKFGQNFIVDENIIDSIINKTNIDKNTLVIEIGPGSGSLTYKLARYSKNVLCYEIDTTLKNILEENLKSIDNVDVIYKDFLLSNVNEDIKKYKYDKIYVVSNLPYYITTPIIVKLIEDKINVLKIVVMVQKEVGDRFKALPGSKEYSSLSVFLGYYFEIKKIMNVSKFAFMPQPNVDSIVLEFKKKEQLLYLKNEELFFKLVKDSFKQKRKTIRNNLKEYDLKKVEEVLKKYGYDLSVRSEQLTINIFTDISNNL